ncbi:MAG: carbonic anhydrase [Desulfarculaceae bacterium]|nr:carbonic anhydrase [Desulfarculaceae bacterium]MCF8071904.1 carbonic anhydrase [Desulfarculaceae bacterium]MCF8103704.1 carbonic anhydrase [Desulfarculaceae bacterium]MCF8114971.1 carbonic anhydrase [Desulfarculaceae bacterium]
MKTKYAITLAAALFLALSCLAPALAAGRPDKPSPEKVLQMLQAGNARFVAGKMHRINQDQARIEMANAADQGEHAFATILSCSDSRVPVELIFDTGIMDLFVVRVAGNVVRTDEAGSIEYGLAHVHTPVLVVLGHTRCGAVTAVAQEVQGHGHALERNIPPLVAPIVPAVKAAMQAHPSAKGAAIVPYAIEQNVWQAISDLFVMSPATRDLVKANKVMVVGAIYDLADGKVHWLPQDQVGRILAAAEKNPQRATEAMAK